MKKMTWKMRLLGGLVAVSMLFAGCAQGVDDETFEAGVTGTQLESPAADSFTYSIVTDATGTEQVKIQWPTVVGAGGYLCSVWNVNDPANPEVLVDNETIDGAALYFPLAEDSSYKISVLTLGNEKYNNAGATEASEYSMNTMIEGIPVPATEDLGAFITKYIADNAATLAAKRAADPNFEIAFDLEPGATYNMAEVAQFDVQPTRVRGDRQNKPIVLMTNNSAFETGGGLKLKFLNIDAGGDGMDAENASIIRMQQNPTNAVIGANTYLCEKPIRMEGCWVKNLKRSFFHSVKTAWGVTELRIADCIIQLSMNCSGGHKSFIYPYVSNGAFNGKTSNYGGILNTMIVNSTIYNTYRDITKDSAYFIRFANKDISKVFGTYNGVFSIQNSTLNRIVPNKDFGNNMPEDAAYWVNINNTIFYDTYRIQKLTKGKCSWKWVNNTIWGVMKSVDGTDAGRIATEDPGFTDDNVYKELDFSQPNGGVNFTPTGTISSTIGDPRWLK